MESKDSSSVLFRFTSKETRVKCRVRIQNADFGVLLDFFEAGSEILLAAALLAQERGEHLVGRHLYLSKWGLLEFA